MDDPEIQKTVESILGKGAKVIDCEKTVSVQKEEVLYINGIPVKLEGRDGMAIKQALITGQVPPCDLLNTLLIKTGILSAPVKLDTSLSVKSTTFTKEDVTVSRHGKVVDERCCETKEQKFQTTDTTEIFEPVRIVSNAEIQSSAKRKYSDTNDGYETGSDWSKLDSPSASGFGSSADDDAPRTVNSQKLYVPLLDTSTHDSGLLTNTSFSSNEHSTKVFSPSSEESLHATNAPPFSFDEPDICSDMWVKCHFRQSPINNVYGGKNGITPAGFSSTGQDKSGYGANGNVLVYRDGNLVSGSLDALIQHMVPTDQYYPDRAYLFAFLLSARLYIEPYDLLTRVISLAELQRTFDHNAPSSSPSQQMFAEHMIQLLTEWTDTFPYDFRDERMMQHLRHISHQCCALNVSLRSRATSLQHTLMQRLAALEVHENSLDLMAASQEQNCTDVSDVCPNPVVLAQQLTHVELERLSFIGPEEFVQAFAKENPHLETLVKNVKKTHNLEQYIKWFNRLSYFVSTQVCKYHKKKQRVKVVEYWIEVGRECFNIGNFNSLMAVISGLNMSPISRLKRTWSKINSGKFAILEHQMDPSSNFSSYRSTLKAAMWRSAGAKDQRQRIVIPFFSLLVKDLYFLNQGCSNRLPNGHINFDKFWQLAKQVMEFMAWKQIVCPFKKDAKLITLLQHCPVLSENALALASFECEPPDSSQEKERLKQLKADNA